MKNTTPQPLTFADVLKGVRLALDTVPNTRLKSPRFASTYDVAAALDTFLPRGRMADDIQAHIDQPGATENDRDRALPILLYAVDHAFHWLTEYLADNTENLFEEIEEVDRARALLSDALQCCFGAADSVTPSLTARLTRELYSLARDMQMESANRDAPKHRARYQKSQDLQRLCGEAEKALTTPASKPGKPMNRYQRAVAKRMGPYRRLLDDPHWRDHIYTGSAQDLLVASMLHELEAADSPDAAAALVTGFMRDANLLKGIVTSYADATKEGH